MGSFERFLKNKSGKKDKLIAAFITMAIVGLLLIAGPVFAITLGITDISDTTPTEGDTISFLAKVDLHTNDVIALKNVTVDITGTGVADTCTFDIAGNILSGCDDMTVSVVTNNVDYNAAAGYGYGYTSNGLYENTSFDYGYGYVFGYGYDAFSNSIGTDAELVYNITYLTPSVSADKVLSITTSVAADDGSNSVTYTMKTAETITVQNSGGGSGSGSTTYIVELADLSEGYTEDLKEGDKVTFTTSNGERHTATIIEIGEDYVIVTVASTPQTVTLNLGESKKFELTGDNYYDLLVTLNSISYGKATITMQSISELMPSAASSAVTGEATTEIETGEGAEEKGMSAMTWILIIVAVIVIVAVIYYLYFGKSKKKR